MIPAYVLLARRIREEIEELERTVRRVERAWRAATRATSDQDLYVDSAVLNLHSFYAGLERLLEFTAYQVDGGPPKGESWHRDLLRQMTTAVTGIRPAVVSADTAGRLDEFRRFRHVVRNVYAEQFEPKRIGKLVGELAALWNTVKGELEGFAVFLEGVSQADDAGEK